MIDEARLSHARKIAETRYAFWWHLGAYAVVNTALVGIWLASKEAFPWPIFPIFFWGIGLFSHYMGAYRLSGHGWVERETQKILSQGQEKGTRG